MHIFILEHAYIKIKYAIIRIVQFMKVKWRSIAIILDIWSLQLFKFLKRPVSVNIIVFSSCYGFSIHFLTRLHRLPQNLFLCTTWVFLSVTYFHRRRNNASPQNLFLYTSFYRWVEGDKSTHHHPACEYFILRNFCHND